MGRLVVQRIIWEGFGMALSSEDLNKIQSAIQAAVAPLTVCVLRLEERVSALEVRVNEGFNTAFQYFDALFKRDETREQENLAIKSQLGRLEIRVSALEAKVH